MHVHNYIVIVLSSDCDDKNDYIIKTYIIKSRDACTELVDLLTARAGILVQLRRGCTGQLLQLHYWYMYSP